MTFKLVGIGELLWDMLPGGRQLGGAPANFTYHARALGAEARLISRVGDDALGREAKERLAALGAPLERIETDLARATGSVTVTVASDGQPQFEIHENVAWDAIHGDSPGPSIVAAADAVCFGTLAQRHEPSRSTIRSLVAATSGSALRILDVNLRQRYFSKDIIEASLGLANVLKVNDTELPQLAEMLGLRGDDRTQIQDLAIRYELRCVALTRGSKGSLLHAQGRWSDQRGVATTVVDTVGAGDAFTAAMTLGLLSGWDLDRLNDLANQVASYVCSQAGATPPLPEKFRRLFASAGS